MDETAVLIAGGGPIGLTLGLELSARGVPCVVVERNATTTSYPKMDLTNSRSMELYGRLGLSERIRDAAVPRDNDFDVAWITGLGGHELHRFRYPSQIAMRERIRARNDGSMPAEPAVRMSQIELEPVLKRALEAHDIASVRFGWAFESLRQDADGVTCLVRECATGEARTVRCRYLVGCDGGGSTVRNALGIRLEGTAGVRQSYMIHFRSRAHDLLRWRGGAWHYQSGRGTLIAQDDDQYWTLQLRVRTGVDPSTLDPRAAMRDCFGADIEADILLANAWTAHLLVADKYRDGRVFLAGDAAHQFVPTGGYGMNTGVGDAVDLGWKLAATIRDNAGSQLLESYEIERRPVALRNREASRANVMVRFAILERFDAAGDIESDTPEAADNRGRLAANIRDLGNLENEQWGTEYGFVYADSPVTAREAGAPPPFDAGVNTPTTYPGARLPSVVLPDGEALYAKLHSGFTLIAFGAVDVGDIEPVAAAHEMSLRLLRLPDDDLARIYERKLVLVRPDHHVAWRGDAAPASWLALVDLVLGRTSGGA